MRYYDIKISDDSGQETMRFQSNDSQGNPDRAALLVEMDIPVAPSGVPGGDSGALIRIWGVSLKQVGQQTDLNDKKIEVFGGMSKGLPLANPKQAGLLVTGTIQQAFGNWIGTSMTLDLILRPPTGSPEAPSNLVFNWLKGTPLKDAVTSALSTAFPDYTVDYQVQASIALAQDEHGFYDSLTQFGEYLKEMTAAAVGGDYAGVDVSVTGKKIQVYDQPPPDQDTVAISFTDLIGQPTWYGFNELHVTTVMRSDIIVGSKVQMPKTLQTTTAQSFSQYRDSSVFQGDFQVNFVRHIGNSRDPDAQSWVSTYIMTPVGAGQAPGT